MSGAEQSKRALALCDKALELAAAKRDRFLDDACAGDAGLRASVNSVLLAIDNAGDFLGADSGPIAERIDFAGRRIGHYQIRERLGEGGMGSVYLAERHEEGFDQQVAVKFVHGHLMAKELIGRFNAERQILAALNHPYIAALIDGGTTDDGIPFIVMEYVDGEKIDQYCDSRQLGIAERIKLIQKVAMAVQAAHQNLIVHRDLKPSNVLVTADGIPKLLDFGIAKLIRPEGATTSGATTIFGHQALTPDYASPEQILENKVTTASDVYTLGVLSYQLLVGELPYHILTTNHREMMRSLDGLSVPRPSSRLDTLGSAERRDAIAKQRTTTPQRLQRALQGDLDNILLMALRQEPERRYPSVAQFSEDLSRYLSGMPVRAREDSFRYRTTKFLQRNWLPVGAAALLVLTLAAGLVGYATQASEAQRQRDIARTQALHAENTVGFLKDVLFVGDPFATSENEQTIADVLQYAQELVGKKYAGSPESRAAILAALAEISTARGEYQRSASLASEAVSLYENTLGTDSNQAANAYRVQALATFYLSDYETAARQFRVAIDTYLAQPETDIGGLVGAYDQMGMTQGNLTNEATALEYYNLALNTYREHELDDAAQLITVLGNIATEHLQKGDYDLAGPVFVEAIDIARQSGASDGHTAMLMSNYAGVLHNMERSEDALRYYENALELMSVSIGLDHPDAIVTQTSVADLYQKLNKLDRAEEVARKAVAAAGRSLPPDHFITSYVQNVSGSILCRNGKPEEGMALARASLKTRQKLLPPEHWAISSGEGIVGTCLVASGSYAQAESMLLPAYAALLESRGEGHEVTLAMKARVHALYTAWGKPDKARDFRPAD